MKTITLTIVSLLVFLASCTPTIHLPSSGEVDLPQDKRQHFILIDDGNRLHIHTYASHNGWKVGNKSIALLSPYITYSSRQNEQERYRERDELVKFLREYLLDNYSFTTYLEIPELLGDFDRGFYLTQPLTYEHITSPFGPAAKNDMPIVESLSIVEVHPALFPRDDLPLYSLGLRMHGWEGSDQMHISLFILDNRKEELVYIHDLQYAGSPKDKADLLLAIEFMLGRVFVPTG